jgi:protein-S-isoprenylcysteine O-methyltransferase Ste14
MGASAPTVRTATPAGMFSVSRAGLGHAGSNLLLAAAFFAAAAPTTRHYDNGIANLIWIAGAALMGVFSLVRNAPSAVRIDLRAICATVGMLIFPSAVRPDLHASGAIAAIAIALEIAGLLLSQGARIWMGRSFGVFPANRGIVSTGPFRIVRHPIYLGWFILTLGYALSYPTVRNVALILATIPFLVWRIALEEELLAGDPEYRAYESRVRSRLLPGLV